MNKFIITFGKESYYTIDNQKIYSKIKAIELANGDMSRIHFNWMEDTWQSIDWTVEPTESWQSLLKIRCQQIRDKYSYLALWYSSGYDSHTILRSFVDNNILLDELLIIDRRDFFPDPEVTVAISHAEYIKNTYYPNLKINVIRVSYESLGDFYKKSGTDWIYHAGCSLKVGKTTRYFSTTLIPEFISTTEQTNRGDIMGIDKAKVLLRDNQWYAFCPDNSAVDFIGSKQENFFYSNDLPQLHIKQCHMVISWFESLPQLSSDLVHDVQGRNRTVNGVHSQYYESWNIGMGRFPLMHSHEYSRNGDHKFFNSNNEKSPDNISYYEYIKNSDKQVFKIYTEGLVKARQFDTGINGSLADRTLLSKQYYIKNQAH
jgi:hypothetical protein